MSRYLPSGDESQTAPQLSTNFSTLEPSAATFQVEILAKSVSLASQVENVRIWTGRPIAAGRARPGYLAKAGAVGFNDVDFYRATFCALQIPTWKRPT